ncbi:MAG: hypothetical protein AABZ06_08270 [Bdellovibrionota bacterium]
MTMILQERDKKILKICYEQQFLLSEQVHRYFFKDRKPQAMRHRLLMLERAGYIKRKPESTLDGKRLIRITRTGLRAITERIVIPVSQVNKPDVRTLRHDTVVTSVRLRLSEIWTGHWLPERVIKAEDFPQIPDGIFIFPSGKKVAIEVENTPKPRARFFEIMERWRKVDVKLILYVATTQNIFRIIQRMLPDGPQRVPFSLILWEDLKNGTPPVWSPGGTVNIFSRKEY